MIKLWRIFCSNPRFGDLNFWLKRMGTAVWNVFELRRLRYHWTTSSTLDPTLSSLDWSLFRLITTPLDGCDITTAGGMVWQRRCVAGNGRRWRTMVAGSGGGRWRTSNGWGQLDSSSVCFWWQGGKMTMVAAGDVEDKGGGGGNANNYPLSRFIVL